jgi:hypothetical protein
LKGSKGGLIEILSLDLLGKTECMHNDAVWIGDDSAQTDGRGEETKADIRS